MTPLVIGIDSSTNACKAIAWDPDGVPVAEARATYPLLRPEPDWYEQDADQWWTGTVEAIRHLVRQVSPERFQAICIANQRESFVPVDGSGRPTRNAILWLDERSRAQVTWIERVIGREEFHSVTGKPLTTNPSITKIAWLLEHEPSSIGQAAMVLDAHAFLVHRLTGRTITSLASADPMGLVDMRTGDWADLLLDALGLTRSNLPELALPGTILGGLAAGAAQATGLQEGMPVVAGAGDGQCAGLGVNATGGGRASLNLGTAVVSGRMEDEYHTSLAFRTLHAASSRGFFAETVIQGGAFTVSWLVDRLLPRGHATGADTGSISSLEAAAAELPPGAMGLVLVPYWNHAMTPYWDSAATGITIGWTGGHGAEHLYRAILEGIAFEQRLLGEGLSRATGQTTSEYIVMGGGSQSDLWCQILADVTAVPILRAGVAEATSLGAGILAAAAVGWYPDTHEAAAAMTRTGRVFSPDCDAMVTYNALYTQVYRDLYPSLQPLMHRLSDIRQRAGLAATRPSRQSDAAEHDANSTGRS
jgi:xylulokinase